MRFARLRCSSFERSPASISLRRQTKPLFFMLSMRSQESPAPFYILSRQMRRQRIARKRRRRPEPEPPRDIPNECYSAPFLRVLVMRRRLVDKTFPMADQKARSPGPDPSQVLARFISIGRRVVPLCMQYLWNRLPGPCLCHVARAPLLLWLRLYDQVSISSQRSFGCA